MKNLKNVSLTALEDQLSSTCIVCKKLIAAGQCFCRLPQKTDAATTILLCSPYCALQHFAANERSRKEQELLKFK
jgi:hypothetical protein